MYVPRPDVSISLENIIEHTQTTPSITIEEARNLHLTHLCTLHEPATDGISFAKAENTREAGKILAPRSLGALIIQRGLTGHLANLDIPLLESENPYLTFCSLVPFFFDRLLVTKGIHPRAEISPSAVIGKDVCIGAFAVIGDNVEIGEGAVIHPHAVIYPHAEIGRYTTIHSGAVIRERCKIGAMVVIQNGAVIGSDGFGYIPVPGKGLVHVPHVGNVNMADGVEVGANSCIDRGALGDTVVGTGTKLDNLVQVGHNNQIGSHSVLCGLVGIAGSCKIGNEVIIGGGAGIRDHTIIVDKVRVGGQAAVITDLTEPGDYTGFPAIRAADWRRQAFRAIKESQGRDKKPHG